MRPFNCARDSRFAAVPSSNAASQRSKFKVGEIPPVVPVATIAAPAIFRGDFFRRPPHLYQRVGSLLAF